MKKVVTGLMVAVFTIVMCANLVMAAKDNSSSVSGELALAKDDKGAATGITITTKSGTVYNIDMTGFSQDCSEMDGKQVTAKGDVKDVDGKMVLKVKGYISGPGAKKSAAKGKAKGKKAGKAEK